MKKGKKSTKIKKSNKKKNLMILASVLLLLLLGAGYYFFIYQSDTGLLNRADKQLEKTEEMITTEGSTDDELTDEIGSEVTEEENDMDELEASFNAVLSALEDVEDAESEIGSAVE
ncbi:MAG TPA: hypothetical protein PLC53_01225 [Bacilli bacterium]|nr:hypothetical protein [Bacilli bacterium]